MLIPTNVKAIYVREIGWIHADGNGKIEEHFVPVQGGRTYYTSNGMKIMEEHVIMVKYGDENDRAKEAVDHSNGWENEIRETDTDLPF